MACQRYSVSTLAGSPYVQQSPKHCKRKEACAATLRRLRMLAAHVDAPIVAQAVVGVTARHAIAERLCQQGGDEEAGHEGPQVAAPVPTEDSTATTCFSQHAQTPEGRHGPSTVSAELRGKTRTHPRTKTRSKNGRPTAHLRSVALTRHTSQRGTPSQMNAKHKQNTMQHTMKAPPSRQRPCPEDALGTRPPQLPGGYACRQESPAAAPKACHSPMAQAFWHDCEAPGQLGC